MEIKNMIYTGAPGTGKTYKAREEAEKFVRERGGDDSNIEFVQFHPSYDYTDFVEGLRPIDKGDGQIGFKYELGTFKKFCQKALEHPEQDFVFIIDEINRGEISKIFGELFFAIDPGYRGGKKGKVKTQYHNMIPQDDTFKDGFFVPDNVYIIGTMNDIDRSVDHFDFAVRRRFTWKEIEASKYAEEMFRNGLPQEYRDDARKRMNALNHAISNDIKPALGNSYHIGGAFFLKLNEHRYSFNELWEYHLEPLFREYFRGMPNMKDNLEILKKAYDG